VLKPSGHLLSFGGTRTYHRMACAIEDAGFEVRDQLQWVYGSGFPKSVDISKAIDKVAGAERTKIRIPACNVRNPKSINGGHGISGGDRPWMQEALERGYHEADSAEAVTPEARQWNGWGTALKPANEPVCLARKPLAETTIAANVLKWGTGGLNISGCRIPVKADDMSDPTDVVPHGRFPANILLDEEAAAMLDEQSGRLASGKAPATGFVRHSDKHRNTYGRFEGQRAEHITLYGDSGGASRFFYVAKASKSERGTGNTHPTVKPVKLMRYLARLITPPGGTVLDPFAGSGTTLLAAEQEGFDSIGIEMNPEYCEIIRKRMAHPEPVQACLL